MSLATPGKALARLERYRRDPVLFAEEVLRWKAWSRQREILYSIRDNPRTAVASCHGPGKTATSAVAALWYLSVFPHSRVITTAPTMAQLRDVLWREITALYYASEGFLAGELFGTRLEIAPDWFAVGLTTDSPERFQGHHAEHLLLIVDEASGVEEQIFEAAAGSLTTPEARLLMIGNPTRTSGEFYAAFHASRSFYNTIRISAFDTPAFTGERVSRTVSRRLVSKKWVETMTRKWGEGSPLYAVRIAAEFPSTSDDTVIALGDLEQAQRRELEPGLPVVLSADIARFGSDETVLAVRRGNQVRIAKSYSGKDTMKTTGEITRLARDLERQHGRKPLLVIDDAGLGGGVTDRLRELREFEVVAFTGAAASKSKEYPRKRDEAWFRFSELLPDLDLPADDELAADLLAPRYALDSQGRRAVEAKGETKRRLRRSPDRGDAVVMAFAMDRASSPMRTASAVRRLGGRPRGFRPRPEADLRAAQRTLEERLGAVHDPIASALSATTYSPGEIKAREAEVLGRRRRSGGIWRQPR